jgi:hypothetical protein
MRVSLNFSLLKFLALSRLEVTLHLPESFETGALVSFSFFPSSLLSRLFLSACAGQSLTLLRTKTVDVGKFHAARTVAILKRGRAPQLLLVSLRA